MMTAETTGRMRWPWIVGIVSAGLAGMLVVLVTQGPRPGPSARGLPRQDTAQNAPGFIDDPILRLFDPQEPLMISNSAQVMSSASAIEQRVDYDLYVVGADRFVDPPEYWFDRVSEYSGIRYGSEMVMFFDAWEKGQNPATEYAQQAKDWEAGEATEIGGHPAWVIPAHSRRQGEPPVAVVELTLSDASITLVGQMSIDELVSVAKDLVAVD